MKKTKLSKTSRYIITVSLMISVISHGLSFYIRNCADGLLNSLSESAGMAVVNIDHAAVPHFTAIDQLPIVQAI